ncbi:MAG: helix-turn-helix domain-containing protein [Archangium sp.]
MRDDTRSRGVLDEAKARGVYGARRVLPSDDLAEHIAYFWLVKWELDEPFEQHALTLPAAHFVFEQRDGQRTSRAVGPWRKRFTRKLEGRGHILGIAFHAGGGAPWLRAPVSTFTDRMTPLSEVLGDVSAVERSILGARSDDRAVANAENFLRRIRPVMDAESRLAVKWMTRIQDDRELLRIEQLISASGIPERQLQRLFARCVGISPKAVIRRFRLVEAADALAKGRTSLTALAMQLGYFDQSHFIRDFRAVVGRAPKSYANDQR